MFYLNRLTFSRTTKMSIEQHSYSLREGHSRGSERA
jgi:hypothetical protein